MERKQQVGECWVCVILFLGASRQYPGKFLFKPYIRWADLAIVLCVHFAHGFGHDGFLPMVYCRSGQGNYDYVLI